MGFQDRNQNAGGSFRSQNRNEQGAYSGGYRGFQRPVEEPRFTPPPITREQALREAHIVFKNKCYSTQQLSLLSRCGSKITINAEDMHKGADTLVDTTQGSEAKTHARIVVTQFEGKMVVLMGHIGFIKAEGKPTQAYLISNVILKKAHIWDN